MADTTGTVKPDDFHATSEPADAAAALVVDPKPDFDPAAAPAAATKPAADAAAPATGKGDVTAKDFHATSEPLNSPDDFHATDEKA
ncbi:hypothetical protein AB0D30_16560 [Streptomyces sp. NPDC048409]|jgi:hypothetical protein|uniref:hypothetical protein n=1 Tax=Streptomyces TaxID=1883 RepID=UPI00331E4F63